MIQTWLFSVQRQLSQDTVLEVAYNGNHSHASADHRRLQPGGSERCPVARWACRRGVPIPSFGPITWVDPAGHQQLQRLLRALRAPDRRRAVPAEFVYMVEGAGRFRAGARSIIPGYTVANPQNIHDLAAEYGPSSFDLKLSTSPAWSTVAVRQRAASSRQNMNPSSRRFSADGR